MAFQGLGFRGLGFVYFLPDFRVSVIGVLFFDLVLFGDAVLRVLLLGFRFGGSRSLLEKFMPVVILDLAS